MIHQANRFILFSKGVRWDKTPEIIHYFFTHRHKCMTALQKIFGEGLVTKSLFMRNDVVCNTNDAGMFILLNSSEDRPECGTHERQPISHDNNIRALFSQPVSEL